jgi:peptide/nickel transport system substrate-binding protein
MTGEPTLDALLEAEVTRRHLLRKLGAGGLALSTPALLAACRGSSGPAPRPKAASGPTVQVDHLTWLSAGGGATSLDVARGGDPLAASIATEPILVYDKNLKPVGHLAESWRAVDPVTYVYNIRKGVKYWDGSPLIPEDVAFAMRRNLDPKTQSQLTGLIPPVKGIEVTGPYEVTVRLKEPNITWQYLPVYILVAPKKLIEQQGKDFGAPGKAIMGTGPYKVTSIRDGDAIEYVANDAYWGPKPPAKRLTVKVGVTDAQTALLAMRAGSADGTFGVNTTVLRQWKRIPGVNTVVTPGPRLMFASFDVEAKPWNDIHVRRAFAYALDRRGLVRALLQSAGRVEDSIVPRAVWGAVIPEDQINAIYAALPVYDFDLVKARQELAQSAYPNGLTATVWYYTAPANENIALTWQENLKKIGVTLKLEVASDAIGASREDNHHDLGLHLNDGWAGGDYADPVDFALTLLPSSSAKPNAYNEANYKNPIVDGLIKQNLAITDVAKRAELMAQVMKIVATDLPYVPIWTRDAAVAISDKFVYEGLTPYHPNDGLWVNHIKRAA